MEQLVILIIIGLISLVNWVMQKAAEQREAAKMKRVEKREVRRQAKRNIYTQPAPAPASPPVTRRQTTARDPFKDLMDALGLPADELPPPPVVRRTEVFEEEEFASIEEAAPPPVPAPARESRAPRWQAPTVRRPDEKTARLAYAFTAVGQTPAPARHGGSHVRELLATRDSQRQAIIVAEILGTPRGLAPFRAM